CAQLLRALSPTLLPYTTLFRSRPLRGLAGKAVPRPVGHVAASHDVQQPVCPVLLRQRGVVHEGVIVGGQVQRGAVVERDPPGIRVVVGLLIVVLVVHLLVLVGGVVRVVVAVVAVLLVLALGVLAAVLLEIVVVLLAVVLPRLVPPLVHHRVLPGVVAGV